MTRIISILLLLAALLFPLTAAAGLLGLFRGNVPDAAADIADQIDEQLMARYATVDGQSRKQRRQLEGVTRAGIIIMGTSPANINNLEESSPLARQMMEEVTYRLMDKGYRFIELRKGRDIRFDKQRGEFLLTRDTGKLATTRGVSHAIMAGTFVVTPKQVRFSVRLIHTPGSEVLAMGAATVPVTPDLKPLLRDKRQYRGGDGGGDVPPVTTRLQ